jgi:hypothetical protein
MAIWRSAFAGMAVFGALHISGIALAADTPAPTHNWPQLGVETSFDVGPGRGIYNFTADSDDGIWLQDIRGQWYYGTIMGSCRGLTFAFGIGYDTFGSSRFDKSSTIIVDGWKCGLSSLVTSDRPPPKKEIKARYKARVAAQKLRAQEAKAAKAAANGSAAPAN